MVKAWGYNVSKDTIHEDGTAKKEELVRFTVRDGVVAVEVDGDYYDVEYLAHLVQLQSEETPIRRQHYAACKDLATLTKLPKEASIVSRLCICPD